MNILFDRNLKKCNTNQSVLRIMYYNMEFDIININNENKIRGMQNAKNV